MRKFSQKGGTKKVRWDGIQKHPNASDGALGLISNNQFRMLCGISIRT